MPENNGIRICIPRAILNKGRGKKIRTLNINDIQALNIYNFGIYVGAHILLANKIIVNPLNLKGPFSYSDKHILYARLMGRYKYN